MAINKQKTQELINSIQTILNNVSSSLPEPLRPWLSDILLFHELVPDLYTSRPKPAECTVLFLPGYSMTANGASPLMANICAAGFAGFHSNGHKWQQQNRSATAVQEVVT